MNDISKESVSAIRVPQWLESWDQVIYDPAQNQSKPLKHFYLLSLPASKLRSLAGIHRRNTKDMQPRKEDLRIQRQHDPERSAEIRRYVEGGYPWSGLSDAKRKNAEFDKLRKPGWLPTAVVVNILNPGEERSGKTLDPADTVTISDDPNSMAATLQIPSGVISEDKLFPLEVIDGQHRLFAFEHDDSDAEDYHLPVVAFHGLDISWQAYLFWTINIKPKKINPSLAFDLYPLLREQNWLEGGEVVHVYKESRAQELTEMLWATPSSPWYRRINMIGGRRIEHGPVTQAAFIRSLTASMVKSWRSNQSAPGGIFGGTPNAHDGLAWSRLQQAAFLLTAWTVFAEQIADSKEDWAEALRDEDRTLMSELGDGSELDAAFVSQNSLIATDQGVRGFQYIVNDLFYAHSHELNLRGWDDDSDFTDVTPETVAPVIESFKTTPSYNFLVEVCANLATFDWRNSKARDLTDEQRRARAVLRGSGGYRELRAQLTEHLRENGTGIVKKVAKQLPW